MIEDRQGVPAVDLLRALVAKIPIEVLAGKSRHLSASDASVLSRYQCADRMGALLDAVSYAVYLVAALDRVRPEVVAMADGGSDGSLLDRGTFARFVLGQTRADEIPRGSGVLWADLGQQVAMTGQLCETIGEYTRRLGIRCSRSGRCPNRYPCGAQIGNLDTDHAKSRRETDT